jgi:hypothetical protein
VTAYRDYISDTEDGDSSNRIRFSIASDHGFETGYGIGLSLLPNLVGGAEGGGGG